MGAFLDKPVTDKVTEAGESKSLEIKYAVSSMQGWRVNMEDSHVHKLGLNLAGSSQPSPLSDVALFAVFDGHGGDYIAKDAAIKLPTVFSNTVAKSSIAGKDHLDILKGALCETFLTLDREMRELPKIKSGEDSSGCTAVSAAVTKDAYVIANAGDSRCIVIGESGRIKFASKDHKPDLPEETERISKAGGYVSMRRVNGDLAVSRGLGDYLYKRDTSIADEKQQVSPLPDVSTIDRDAADLFLVLACDGIWDVMTNEDCSEFLREKIKEGYTLQECAEQLLAHCLELNSRDNMSVILVGLPALDKIPKVPRSQAPKISSDSMDIDNSSHESSDESVSISSNSNGADGVHSSSNNQQSPQATNIASPKKGKTGNADSVSSPRSPNKNKNAKSA